MRFVCALVALLLIRPGVPAGVARGEPTSGWAPVVLASSGRAAEVPVVVHVVTGDGGALTDEVLVEQIAVLNRAFAGEESPEAADTGFSFRLREVRPVHQPRWFSAAGRPSVAAEMRAATRVGGADVLNVWTVDLPRLGFATLPSSYSDYPDQDGVVIDWASVPGGSAPGAGLGKTLVHEAGHWLGLWHTFENGCTPLNDEVDDTPAQASPSSGCPVGRDSCGRPGADPIHNYMDYSTDDCYNQFTEGQAERMRAAWTTYRLNRRAG